MDIDSLLSNYEDYQQAKEECMLYGWIADGRMGERYCTTFDVCSSTFFTNLEHNGFDGVDKFAKANNVILYNELGDGDTISSNELLKRTNLTKEQVCILDAADGTCDGNVKKDVFNVNNFHSKTMADGVMGEDGAHMQHSYSRRYPHVILKDEFEGGMCNLAKKVLSENVTKHEPNPELSKIYNSFDTDNDGHVSDEEFQVGIEKLSELKSNTSARECNNSATLDLDLQDKEKNIG